ncbi:hypothetical protein WA158_005334 [Blastocystis sp. Blastoise]
MEKYFDKISAPSSKSTSHQFKYQKDKNNEKEVPYGLNFEPVESITKKKFWSETKESKDQYKKYLEDAVFKNAPKKKSDLFKGYSFYFTGYLGSYSRYDLVRRVHEYGGCTEHFYAKLQVNVIVAVNLSLKKTQDALKGRLIVVHPQWIIDCIEKNKIIDCCKYSVLPTARKGINSYFDITKEK